jgi:hypothetical protein
MCTTMDGESGHLIAADRYLPRKKFGYISGKSDADVLRFYLYYTFVIEYHTVSITSVKFSVCL